METLHELLRAAKQDRLDVPVPPVHEPEELLRACRRRSFDVILLDVDGGTPSATIETIRRVKAESPHSTLLVLFASRGDRDLMVLDFVQAGADGLVDRAAELDDVVEALVAAAEGAVVLSEENVVEILPRAAWDRDSRRRAGELQQTLTPREREILELIVERLGNEEIAERLHVSTRTVATHVQNCYRKMNVHSRIEAVSLATRLGLTTLEEPPDPHGMTTSIA